MSDNSRFEITKYDNRPRSSESAIDERHLLAGIMSDKEIYSVVQDMQMLPWAWNDLLSRSVYAEFCMFVEQKGYERAMQCSMGSDNKAYVKALRYFIENEDPTDYTNQMRMINEINGNGRYGLISLLEGHIRERKRIEAKASVNALLRRIEYSEPFSDEVDDLQKFLPERGEKAFYSLSEISDMIEDIEEELACCTGFRALDRRVKIREGGCLVVIGGESSSGKTTFTNQVAWHISKMDIGRSLFFSTETDHIRLGRRIHKHVSCIEQTSVSNAQMLMKDHDTLMITNRICHVDEIISTIRKEHKSEAGVRFVYIDYLQNLQYKQTNNVVHDIEQVVKKIHHLAQELKIVIFLLAQPVKSDTKLNQFKEKPAPTLSSFRGCAALGNAADIAIFLQRPDWIVNEDQNVRTDFHVIKNKEGPQVVIPAELVQEHFTFIERAL